MLPAVKRRIDNITDIIDPIIYGFLTLIGAQNQIQINPNNNGPTLYLNAGTFTQDRQVTFNDPGANDNVVYQGASQTITNKTFTSPTINTPTISSPTITGTGVASFGNVTAGYFTSISENVQIQSQIDGSGYTNGLFMQQPNNANILYTLPDISSAPTPGQTTSNIMVDGFGGSVVQGSVNGGVTLNARGGFITGHSLTSSQTNTFTFTNSWITASSFVLVSINNVLSTTGKIPPTVASSNVSNSGTCTITVTNNDSANALGATIIQFYIV